MLKPTELWTSRTEPEGQRCELTRRTGVQVGFQKVLSNKKGISCPFLQSLWHGSGHGFCSCVHAEH